MGIYEMEKEIETLKGNVSNNANDIASNEAQISMNSANITAAGDQVNMDALDEMKDKIDGTTPVTCGGDCSNTKCYNIIDGTEFAQMDKGRYAQGFVMINPSTLWITGGSCGNQNGYTHNLMPFTEFISTTPNVTGPGPDLPVNMNAQCLTKVGDKVYVIGGRKAPGDNGASYTRLDTVYIYDFSQFDTTGQPTGPETGPTLNLGRESFGCGTLENGAIIVAGGDGTVGGRTNTAEILLPGATSWITLTENLPESWR